MDTITDDEVPSCRAPPSPLLVGNARYEYAPNHELTPGSKMARGVTRRMEMDSKLPVRSQPERPRTFSLDELPGSKVQPASNMGLSLRSIESRAWVAENAKRKRKAGPSALPGLTELSLRAEVDIISGVYQHYAIRPVMSSLTPSCSPLPFHRLPPPVS